MGVRVPIIPRVWLRWWNAIQATRRDLNILRSHKRVGELEQAIQNDWMVEHSLLTTKDAQNSTMPNKNDLPDLRLMILHVSQRRQRSRHKPEGATGSSSWLCLQLR